MQSLIIITDLLATDKSIVVLIFSQSHKNKVVTTFADRHRFYLLELGGKTRQQYPL